MLVISTAHHWYSFPAPHSPTVFFPPLSLDRGPWVKHRGECSITTRSDPIKCRFNQPCSQRVNTKSHQTRGNRRPGWCGQRDPSTSWRLGSIRLGPTHQFRSSAGWCKHGINERAQVRFLFMGCSPCSPSPARPPRRLQLLIVETFSSAQESGPVIWSTAPQWPIKVHRCCRVTFRVPGGGWCSESGCGPC